MIGPTGAWPSPASRRAFLRQAGGGFGAIAAAWMLEQDRRRHGSASPNRARRAGRRTSAAKAKRVIYLFMHGGPSHLETFDPKPDLQRLAGPAAAGAASDPSRPAARSRPTRCWRPSGRSASTARAG